MADKKIIGIGNALMDVVVKLPNDEILQKNNLPKGSMTLVNAAVSQSLNQQTDDMDKLLAPGGSVANSISGLASLGASTAFIGKVGDDELGRLYQQELEKMGAKTELFKTATPTGVAMALVTPDSERTFGTYLGAAIELSADDLNADLFRGYDIAYIEGYLVQNHDLVKKAAELAKGAGLKIALDLASFNVVEDNLDFLKEIVSEYVDILFANEEEANAFTGKDSFEAVEFLGGLCDIAVVKLGSKGSLMKHGGILYITKATGTTCIDTTGAGDLYAAGFLYGLSKNLPLGTCGNIGSIVAGKVITVYGARMDAGMWKSINAEVEDLIKKDRNRT